MTMRVKIALAAAILAAATGPGARGQAVELLSVAGHAGASVEWDAAREIARVSTQSRQVTLKLGVPFVMVDHRRKENAEPAFRKDGMVMLPQSTAALLSSLLVPAQPESGMPRVAVVLIDPGHGGKDPGAIGRIRAEGETKVVREKDIVLAVSKNLRDLLAERFPQKRVQLTRETDEYLTLEARTEKANAIPLAEGEAIIFISVHVNAALKRDASGFEVWYLPPEFRRDLSDRTGVADAGKEIIPILSSMLEEEYTTESVLLARSILAGLDEQVGEVSENRGLKEEVWFVVRNSKMPAVLIELGFVTNQVEAGRMVEPDHLNRLSRGIYNGVTRFIERYESSRGFTQSS